MPNPASVPWLRVYLTAIAFTSASHTVARASDEEDLALAYGDKSTISIATGGQQPTARAPAVATVLTARDFEAMGATDLDQALESVPGLHVSTSSLYLLPIYSFRGILNEANSQVLMLVNGLPITAAFQGDRGMGWGGMPLENVARIEVIRGPGSALYGADAFSGVINIITKTADDVRGTEGGLRVGSFNGRDAWVQHGGKLGPLDASFYLRDGTTDGEKRIIEQDAQSHWDQVFGTHVSLAPGPIEAQRKALDARTDISYEAWRFRATYQKREVGMGAGLAGSLDPGAYLPETRRYVDVSYVQANWAKNWDISAVIGYYDIDHGFGVPNYVLFPAGAFNNAFPNGMIGNPASYEKHTNAGVSAVYAGFERHRVRLGTGFRNDAITDTPEIKNFDANLQPLPGGLTNATGNPALVFMQPHTRHISYEFVQDEWAFARDWALTVGVRHDQYSDFGGTTNPRLAVVWDAAYNLVVKAMHGSAFRAPSFQELYSINNPVTFGNPTLRPETIKTDELAFSWQATSTLKNDLNFFHYRMSDIIRPNPLQYQNVGDQVGRGLELESTFDATGSVRLTGSYSLQHSVNSATGQDAGMAPHRRLFARADWRLMPPWQVGTTVNHVADRMREPNDPRPQIPDYTTVDLTLHRDKLVGDWDVQAMLTNLFNANAMEPTFVSVGMYSDLPLPGRAFCIQLEHSL